MEQETSLFIALLIFTSFISTTITLNAQTIDYSEISSFGTIVYSAEPRTRTAIKIDYLKDLTSEELANLAIKYDLLITWLNEENKDAISRLYTINPEMKILGYRNVAYVGENEDGGKLLDYARQNGWILKDIDGNEVQNLVNTVLKRADVGNPDFRDWLSDLIKNRTDSLGIDGIMGDVTACRITMVNADPINPRTGEIYTDQDYSADMLALVKRVREKTGKLYLANGVGMLQGSWKVGFWYNRELAEPIVNEVDGVLIEGLIRYKDSYNWRNEEDWKKDLEFLDFLNKKGKLTIAWTIVSGDIPEGATEDQIAMFGFVTHLLVLSDDNDYYTARGYEEQFYDVVKIKIGNPLEDFHTLDGTSVVVREFSKSLILLNPSENTYNIPIVGSYKTLDGQIISEIVLISHTGIILLKID